MVKTNSIWLMTEYKNDQKSKTVSKNVQAGYQTNIFKDCGVLLFENFQDLAGQSHDMIQHWQYTNIKHKVASSQNFYDSMVIFPSS